MAERMPRLDPLTVLAADDVNTLSAGIEANLGIDVSTGIGDVTVPEDAKIVAKVFYADRPSNNAGYVDIEWPGEPFDGLIACIPMLYGNAVLGRVLQVNSANSTGASLRLYNMGSDGSWDADRSSVPFMCLVIGWQVFE